MKKLIYVQAVLAVALLALFFVNQARLADPYISITAIALLSAFSTLIFLSTASWVIVLSAIRLSWVVGLSLAQFGFMYGVMAVSQFGLSLEVIMPTTISFVFSGAFFAPALIRSVVRRRLEKEELVLAKELNRLVDLTQGFTFVATDEEIKVKDKLEKVQSKLADIKRRSK